ncbi:hypothetical protein GALMADRAFT_149116 [Galerina marginata CBS 339.88]|uniref:Uncharacterized protein n=1 Tax=Galerina marginata (strain CBS 339.88) TaxID=685588 RepID=A0A067SB61_GALM3|nr:hypothetical protein GALMADRAFT_149116 [Galerina marginata CBS 339.88]
MSFAVYFRRDELTTEQKRPERELAYERVANAVLGEMPRIEARYGVDHYLILIISGTDHTSGTDPRGPRKTAYGYRRVEQDRYRRIFFVHVFPDDIEWDTTYKVEFLQASDFCSP